MGYAWQGLLKSGATLGMALLAILIMLLQSMVRRNDFDISRQFNAELLYYFVRVTCLLFLRTSNRQITYLYQH